MRLQITTTLVVLAMQCLIFGVFGQVRTPLTIADPLPEEFWTLPVSVVDQGKVTAQDLGPYKSQLLVLDFWAGYCTPCIQAFPKIDSLNRHFLGKATIISVGADPSPQVINSILQRNRFSLPNFYPTLKTPWLASYFPYTVLPHLVWIYRNKVVAITDGEYLNAGDIEDLLHTGGEIARKWNVKKDWLHKGRLSLAAFAPKAVPRPASLATSIFTSFIDGIAPPGGSSIDTVNQLYRVNLYNQSMLTFAHLAYDGTMVEDTAGIVFKVQNKAVFDKSKSKTLDWRMQNTFCYELAIPLSWSRKNIAELIRDDVRKWLKAAGFLIVPEPTESNKKFTIVEEGSNL